MIWFWAVTAVVYLFLGGFVSIALAKSFVIGVIEEYEEKHDQ